MDAQTPTTSAPIDLGQRPKTYFWPLGLETHLLTHIKGAARRAALRKMIEAGELSRIPEWLAKAKLSDEERFAIGRLHPQFMGGEYLPDHDEGEVEIARIEIASTTFDVTSVYAKREGTLIRYRVVDEYEGDTLTGKTRHTSREPLTLGELEEFFLEAWPLLEVLECNFESDPEGMLGFFRGASEFYPDFDRLLRERVIERFGVDDDDAEDEDEDADGAAG
jgi:hypothetical protein